MHCLFVCLFLFVFLKNRSCKCWESSLKGEIFLIVSFLMHFAGDRILFEYNSILIKQLSRCIDIHALTPLLVCVYHRILNTLCRILWRIQTKNNHLYTGAIHTLKWIKLFIYMRIWGAQTYSRFTSLPTWRQIVGKCCQLHNLLIGLWLYYLIYSTF